MTGLGRRPYGTHKRDIMASNILTYTEGPFSYLRAAGSDYEAYIRCLWLIHHIRNPKEASKLSKIGLYDPKSAILLTPEYIQTL